MNDVRGRIFNIIHGSFVDGYGIRTTIFLKGCPLRCVWCCNPEGQLIQSELKYTPAECNGCGQCVSVCPVDCITLDCEADERKINIDRDSCINCGECTQVCYTGALERFDKSFTVEEIFDLVRRDEPFYRSSGGGITIGGGEPTLQPAFTSALIRKCRDNYIHTALDTCGYTMTEEGFSVLKEADLLLYDFKHIDPVEHEKYTGVSNEPILENLKKLSSLGKSIIIRIPLIPGFNDSSVNIEVTATFLAGLKSVERIDLLPYHEYGSIKYLQLGREYTLRLPRISQERIDEIKESFEQYGLLVQIGG